MITELLLTPNIYSRPQRHIIPEGIAIHWVENAGQSALSVRNYFEMRRGGRHGYGSAHYIIDDDTIVRCIPEWEMAYHVGADSYTEYAIKHYGPYPNARLIGIELCHPDWSGKPGAQTRAYLIYLCCDICNRHGFNPELDITTHHAITGKVTPRGPCPKWFIEHPSELVVLKDQVKNCLQVKNEHC